MIRVGVIGYGYWGPNIVRNFADLPDARVAWVTNLQPERIRQIRARYPSMKVGTDHHDIIKDSPALRSICKSTRSWSIWRPGAQAPASRARRLRE